MSGGCAVDLGGKFSWFISDVRLESEVNKDSSGTDECDLKKLL